MILKSDKNAPYKPPRKTVVTDIRHFVVDTRRRVASGAFSVSAGSNLNTFASMDVVVDKDTPYVLKDVHSIVSISGPGKFYIELQGFGEIPEPEVRSERKYFTAVLTAHDFNAGMFLEIEVEDLDNYANSVEVTIQNMRTSETEVAILKSVGRGQFKGILQTRESSTVGANFDGIMYCMPSDQIHITYLDPANAEGQTELIETNVLAVAIQNLYTAIIAPATIPVEKDLVYVIENGDAPVVIRNVRTGYTIHQPYAAPILMGTENSQTSMAAEPLDVIEISTVGTTVNGMQTIYRNINVGADTAPALTVVNAIPFQDELTIEVKDNNMENVVVAVNGVNVQCVPTYYNSGHYRAVIKVGREFKALPGQNLDIVYKTLTKSVLIQPVVSDECPSKEKPDTGVSAAVLFTVNGHFFLNGSFAGTLKIWADEETRLTLIKS